MFGIMPNPPPISLDLLHPPTRSDPYHSFIPVVGVNSTTLLLIYWFTKVVPRARGWVKQYYNVSLHKYSPSVRRTCARLCGILLKHVEANPIIRPLNIRRLSACDPPDNQQLRRLSFIRLISSGRDMGFASSSSAAPPPVLASISSVYLSFLWEISVKQNWGDES